MNRDVYKATLIAYEESIRQIMADYNKIAHEYNANNTSDKFRYIVADFQTRKPLDDLYFTYTN